MGRVTRAAYADAFRKVTGRPLVRLPQVAGRTESEIFFEALALNQADSPATGEEVLGRFAAELTSAFHARRALLTGAIKPNAIEKLRAFALEPFFDTEVGGYGSEVFPKGALLLNARTRAAEKYGAEFTEDTTVYIADSSRDVAAAQMGGARSVGVASGRSSASKLRDAGADVVLADLSDTPNVVRAVDWLTTSVPAG